MAPLLNSESGLADPMREMRDMREEKPSVFQDDFGVFPTTIVKENDLQPKVPLTIDQIAQQFNLIVTYDSLEGAELLPPQSLHELLGHSLTLARDQGGCRFLQKVILEKDPEAVKIVFECTIRSFFDLMMDPFGNYMA